ncbi:MAG: glycosyltransferase family 4 protein [Bacteroidetes bacterium]|nr:glycosyltransferase family 4 protein [Bacteroidota bacterium]MBK8363105.1 glycosyltransferase family 4 protein [Bacteroidota bacterium]MBK9412142.1 glycosyltransferase family 4 protein [Bacteroidota bacterium]MBP6427821.1 glycosyltransferase family 4 protein [Bacteroidia bacterium]
MKILVITNIPNPYRIPLFNELNIQLREKGMDLKVIFAAETYSRRKFVIDLNDCKFEFAFLGSEQISFGNSEKTTFRYGNLTEVLKSENPDRIIVSGFSMATMKVWWYTKFSKAKYLIWSGSVTTIGKGASFIRSLQRKVLAANSAAFIVYGKRAGKYLESLGVQAKRIFKAINTVDTTFFREKTVELQGKSRLSDNKHRLSYVGYLSKRKNVDQLLICIRQLANVRQDFVLDLIGDGDHLSDLQRQVVELKLESFVQFTGFKQKEELPEYYAQTEVFLFQTGFDIWGLVLNEAMAAGLPCIASPNAGAVDDLIEDGKTGFIVDFNNVDRVLEKINFLLDNKEQAKIIGMNASQFILHNAGVKQSAKGFVDAIVYSNNNE